MNNHQKNRRNLWLSVVMISLLTAVGFGFAGGCVYYFDVGFFFRHRTLFAIILFTIVFVTSALTYILFFAQQKVAYKLTLSIFFLLDFALIVFFCLLSTGFLSVVNSVESFQEYLLSAGVWMDILFIALQYLQVIILPLPSFVTLVAGTALFGAVRCFLYSFFAIVLGSLTAFFIGRFLGYKAVAWMVGKETLDAWLKKVKGKDNVVLTAMFLLPFFPDDVLCFIAGLSSMSNKYFIIMIIIARAISVSTTCFSFDFIPFNTWWGILCWVLIGVIIVVAFFLFYKNQDKIQLWLNKHKKKTNNK